MSGKVAVLVADRSQAVRAVLRRLLEQVPGIEVIADVADGRDAARLALERKPLVAVLDLDLPSLSGRALVERIASRSRVPIFVLAPRLDTAGAKIAMGLSNLGVTAVFHKPETPEEWKSFGRTLSEAVRQIKPGLRETGASSVDDDDTPVISRELRFVAIGASTGGPGALFDLLAAIGRRPKLGFAVVQHIAEGFEPALTEWLAEELGIDVAVAGHGEHLRVGTVRVAPGDHHLSIDGGGRLRLDRSGALVGGHRPSVEVLFKSLLGQPANRVAAVLLSGMGSDGAAAMAELRAANVLTVAQDEASCAVFGMPRAAIERRAAALALAPPQIGRLLARAGGGQR
jgi:two-component system chemotaxis response regulator CheB